MAPLSSKSVSPFGGIVLDDKVIRALRATTKKFKNPDPGPPKPPMEFDEYIAWLGLHIMQNPTYSPHHNVWEWVSLAENVKKTLKRYYTIDYSYEKVYLLLDTLKTTVAEGL
jgi:hypothetical protein